jgi:Holliday junction resolvase RusA-like endonuclease
MREGRKLTKEAKAYYDAVTIFARNRTITPATDAERRRVQYEVTAHVYLGKGQRLDADNCGKQICDSLVRAGVIHSDARVSKSTICLHKEDRENPRTEFLVTKVMEI